MKRFIPFFLCLFLLSESVAGQTAGSEEIKVEKANATKRPRLGLVLSGGGAKGVAHIGVLKVLERAGMPIHVITGTSMGSIVGGLYACGNRSQKLDSVVRAQDWSYVLSDREDLSHQSLRERSQQNTYVISKTFNFGNHAKSEGGGLILGKNILTLFDALTTPYNDSIDFSKLPIPFACVATNIVDNTEHDFHSGVLSQAMRASMSIPGVFAPVKKGDMVLVDGGLRNNYPADIAREMGADYIIGVSVQGPPKTADDLHSTPAILGQIVDVNCKNKYDENLAMSDIVIRVNTEGYSAASFTPSAIDTLIRRGEEAAMQHWDEIVALRQKLGPTSNARLRLSTVRVPLPSTGRFRIGQLVFENMTKNDEAFIRQKFRLHEGDSIDNDRADIITTSIRQDLYYESAKFRIQNNPDHTAARVVFTAGPRKQSELRVGLRFDNEEAVALQANAELPLKASIPMDVNITARLGKRMMGRIDWSVHPKSFYRQTFSYAFRHNDLDFYDYGDKAYSLTYNRHTLSLSLLEFNLRNFSIGMSVVGDYYDYRSMLVDKNPEHQEDSNPVDKGYISYQGTVDYNSENEWFFPTRGARFSARFAYYTTNFLKLDNEVGLRDYSAMWRMTFPVGSHFAVQPMFYGRLLCGNVVPLMLSNVMGGEWMGYYLEQQLPFAGVGHMQMAWDKMLAAQLQGQLNITQNNIVLLRLAAAQDANTFSQLFSHRTMLGCSASYYYNTMFGPLGGSLGYSNLTKKVYFYVNLGFVF